MLETEEFHFRLVEWVAVKLLSLNFFHDEATQSFFATVSPNYEYPRRTALTTATVAIHDQMREIVVQHLQQNASKFSFTIDGWTSIRGKSYYGIIVHFIDENWAIHSLALDFVPSHGEHTGRDIATMFFDTLKKAGLEEKIQGITVDNASVNTAFMRELQDILEVRGIDFNAEDQHFHCFPHVLNLAVHDILAGLEIDNAKVDEYDDIEDGSDDDQLVVEDDSLEKLPSIVRLRKLCKMVKASDKLKNKLDQYCQLCDEPYADLPLDVKTRWNSSHDLIKTGLRMRKSISEFTKHTQSLRHLCIDEDEWNLLAIIQKQLQSLKKLSEIPSGDQDCTLPTVVVGINVLLDGIEKFCTNLDTKTERTPIDESLIKAFQSGRDKILKHYSKSNWVYCAALVLDPRHKLETCDKTSWGRELKENSYNYFKQLFHRNYCDESDEISEGHESIDAEDDDDEYSRGMMEIYSSGREKREIGKRNERPISRSIESIATGIFCSGGK